jgi:hypothetical protein
MVGFADGLRVEAVRPEGPGEIDLGRLSLAVELHEGGFLRGRVEVADCGLEVALDVGGYFKGDRQGDALG